MLVNKITKKIFLPLTVALSTVAAAQYNKQEVKKRNYNNDFVTETSIPKSDAYSYYTNEGELKVLELKMGEKWKNVNIDNNALNFITDMVKEGGKYITDRDYIMLDRLMEIADGYDKNTAKNRILEDKELKKLVKKLQKGKLSKEETSKVQTPDIYEIDNWSEGLDRKISYIKMTKSYEPTVLKVRDELVKIGQEMGFKVAEAEIPSIWLEDYAIRRHDGKTYHPINPAGIFVEQLGDEPVVEYRKTTADYDKVMGKSYLEGGNVLNTINSKGEPAAIIGKESVYEALTAMDLEKNKTNLAKVKLKIAEELGLNPKNITYIPQIDFHIDMYYRPLQNGVVAIPDFDTGINILKKIDLPDIMRNNKKKYISRLEEVRDSVSTKLVKAEKFLVNAGYKTVKIPVFAHTSDYGPSTINFMNGICGTSPNGEKYYITNKSEIDELNKIAEKYFKAAGIDKVYFVSTVPFLLMYGGIDCLTQEM